MFDVITIGSATQDIYLENHKFNKFLKNEKTEIDKTIFEYGGGGTNSAVTFANLGFKTAFLGIVGNDEEGRGIKKQLKKYKVDTRFIQIDSENKTTFSIILLSPTEKRRILVCRSTEENLKISDAQLKKLKTKWFYITSVGGNFELLKKIINHANQNQIKVAINPGLSELEKKEKLLSLLKNINILILNFEEACKLSDSKEIKKIFTNIFKNLNGICVITLGAKGTIASNGKEIFEIKTKPKKNIKDATGAGDAFGSAFVSGIILKNDIKYALQLGIANARSVLTEVGAKKGLLTKIPQKFEYKAKERRLK